MSAICFYSVKLWINVLTCNLCDYKNPMQTLDKLMDDRQDRRLRFRPRIPAALRSSLRTDRIPRPPESCQ